jgi:predicted metalloprotease
MWRLYTEAGPLAPVLGLAHEWGHHLQTVLEVKTASTPDREQQADCVAGAWLAYENGRGMFIGRGRPGYGERPRHNDR